MTSKAAKLGTSTSFGAARPVSARRAAISAATGAHTEGVPDPIELPLAVISQNPDNPRDHLRDLDGITQTIKELGVINAITVARIDAYLAERPDRAADLDEGTKYVVVDGHRRLEGARRASQTTIKVIVDDARVATDEALLETAFVANYHRDNMTDLEQAHALEALVKFYGNQSKAAQRLGISQATISSKLSLLKLTPDLQAELASGQRHVEHVRNLGKLTPDEQRAAADARAAEAKRRAEQKRSQPDTTVLESPAGNYHAVIIEGSAPTGEPAADPSEKPSKAASTTPVPLPAQAGQHPTPPANTTPGAEKDTPAAPVPKKMPWHDPHMVATLIRERMTYEDRAKLTALLHEHLQQDAPAQV
jgi:ParB family chromosome partitioning protein